jgi:hypothetical protein
VERDHPIPDWVLDQASTPLDELLNIPTPEEVHELFWAGQQAGEAQGQQDMAPPAQGPAGYTPPPDAHEQARQYCGDFQSGQCGAYADCLAPCPHYAACSQGGVVSAGPSMPEDDIPFEPPATEPPQPESEPAPAARPGGPPPPLRRQQR